MTDENHSICELRLDVAVLKEKALASDKALKLAESLAEKVVEKNSVSSNSIWTHAIAIIATVISLFVLVMQFIKRG